MKKKLLTALLVSVCGLTCSVAAACANSGDSGNQEHEHSYQSGWSYDAENHFHSCTDEDCTATEASAVHTWGEGVEKLPQHAPRTVPKRLLARCADILRRIPCRCSIMTGS